MALTEIRVLNKVEILPQDNAIQVQWKNKILRDGEEVSFTYERKAYSADQKSEFENEVDGAAGYIAAIGW